MQERLSPAELACRRAELERLARTKSPDAGIEDPAFRARFALESPDGKAFYGHFSDEELLKILRKQAKALGRSPAQKETHWVYRSYIRQRFKNWPTALRLAGLSRAAGKCGKSFEVAMREREALRRLLTQVRKKAEELGRMPHPSDLPKVREALASHYQTWGEVLVAAGASAASARACHIIGDLEEEYRDMLRAIRADAELRNRAPLRMEVDQTTRTALSQRCGSWRNALYQVDLEPVRRISPFSNTALRPQGEHLPAHHRGTPNDCYYRVLYLEEATAQDLELVQRTAEGLGRPPTRQEIPPEVRRRLQDACGSWSNALYQLGLSRPKRK